jgi:tetratricopeptide (TPR) repeat protein
MDNSLAQRAIDLALAQNWGEAIKANLLILKTNKTDVDALNRLSRAYAESGHIKKATETAKKALKFDPVNSIAQKSLKKWASLKEEDMPTLSNMIPESFLEDPGKTKLLALIHPGDDKILASLSAGCEVTLLTHPHRVSVVTSDGKYVGRLPDDLAARLRNLIKSGFKYQVLVKSLEERSVKVFIREIARGKNSNGILSFPSEKIDYVSFTPPELVHKETPEVPTSED